MITPSSLLKFTFSSSVLSHMTLTCVLSSLASFLLLTLHWIYKLIAILLSLHHVLTLAISEFNLTSRSSIVAYSFPTCTQCGVVKNSQLLFNISFRYIIPLFS